MQLFNIPMWLKSDIKLKELLEHVGKNEYKKLLRDEAKNTEDKTPERNYTEKVALYFYLADKMNLIEDYYKREPQNQKIMNFIMRDFKSAKNRKAAKENPSYCVEEIKPFGLKE